MYVHENGLDTRRNRALTNYCSPFCRLAVRFFTFFWGGRGERERDFYPVSLHSQFYNIIANESKCDNCRFLEFIEFSLNLFNFF